MSPTPPRIPSLDLPGLTPVAVSELISYGSYEAAALADTDLSGHDLSGAQFLDCLLETVDAVATDLSHVRLASTHLDRWNAPELSAPRSAWQNVEVTGSRLGAVEMFDANLRCVRFVGCKIGWLNLRSARLRDVEFVDCTFEELDLGSAQAERLRFSGCEIQALRADQAQLADVDLRGAQLSRITGVDHLRGITLTAPQLMELSAVLADHLGINIS